MPDWLVTLLKEEGQVVNNGSISNMFPPLVTRFLTEISRHSPRSCSTSRAKSNDAVRIPLPPKRTACVEAKARRYAITIGLKAGYPVFRALGLIIVGKGGFCGYRNIQMLVSQIVRAQATGHERFSNTFPSIFQIQDLIEHAWDMGYNAQGRIETGGIKGTRKYIGTPEAYAVFCSLGIP